MDIQLHIEQYMASTKEDASEELFEFAKAEKALESLRAERISATDAITRGDERGYWRAIESHQGGLFALQKKWTRRLLGEGMPTSPALDAFIVKYGWRRFRFSEINYHVKAAINGESWLFSIIPNYRQENLEKLSGFAACEERQIAIDALEMEGFSQHGTMERLQEILREKRDGLASTRHVLMGNSSVPSFLRLPLSKANSAQHVGDWTLPLRS